MPSGITLAVAVAITIPTGSARAASRCTMSPSRCAIRPRFLAEDRGFEPILFRRRFECSAKSIAFQAVSAHLTIQLLGSVGMVNVDPESVVLARRAEVLAESMAMAMARVQTSSAKAATRSRPPSPIPAST